MPLCMLLNQLHQLFKYVNKHYISYPAKSSYLALSHLGFCGHTIVVMTWVNKKAVRKHGFRTASVAQ